MPRPIWTGTISFGLLNVPVKLYTGERSASDIHFRMLDSRDHAPVKYQRVNSETGEEVPWGEIVKGFEYRKGQYVILSKEELERAGPEIPETVSVEGFVDRQEISPLYYEKPYYLVPGKRAEKGYVLLRETLERTDKVGIGRVVIRTREYLAMIMPLDEELILYLLRYPEEVVDASEFPFPDKAPEAYHINDKELKMAEQLVESMSMEWEPENYQDRYKERLMDIVEKHLAEKGEEEVVLEPETERPEATTNVVDFMSLLKQSLDQKQGKGKSGTKEKAATKEKTGGSASRKETPRKSAPGKSTASRSRSGGGSRKSARSGHKHTG